MGGLLIFAQSVRARLFMIIYLHGADSYRRQRKLELIVGEYKKKHSGLTFNRFYLDEDSDDEWYRFKDFASSQSLFGDKKLAVVSDLFAADLAKDEIKFIKSLTDKENITALFSEEKKPLKTFSFLLKTKWMEEFDILTDKKLFDFIVIETRRREISLTSVQLRELANIYIGDTWGLITELDKIALSKQITIRGNKQSGYSFFNLINKLKSENLGNRLTSLEILLKKEDSAKIFNLAAYSAGIGQKSKFADHDVAIKSGKLDYEMALLDLLID